jgi:hypothetical protein
MSFTTETLDKAYLEYSNITSAKTAKELKLEQENKMMRECLEFYAANGLANIEIGQIFDKRLSKIFYINGGYAREVLNKLTRDKP